MNLTAGVLLRWPSYPKNDGSKALGADVCESRANSQSRTGCLSFCAGLSRLKRPIKSNTCDVPRYFLTGTRTNSCPPLLRTLLECCKHRTQGTTARRCAQKLFCCLRWQLWQKTKADGCKRHPTHPRALPGNIGGCKGARPTLLGAYQGASESSWSPVCLGFRGNFRRGVSRKSETGAVFLCGFRGHFSFVKDLKSYVKIQRTWALG